MRQRKQFPTHFFVQECAHVLAIYETSACMREVNYIIVTDITRTINGDLMVGKRPAALITIFFTKRGRKDNLYFVDILWIYILFTKCALHV